MKRLTLLAVALVMVLGMAASASAADVTISGNILTNAVWKANWDFDKDNGGSDQDHGEALAVLQRANLAFTAVANENLKGVLNFRSQRNSWGRDGLANGEVGGDGGQSTDVLIAVQQAYIDFMWPGTAVNVKAGLQSVALPAAVGGGSMIQDDNATALMVSTNLTDGVDLLLAFARFEDTANTAADTYQNELDGWIVALPVAMEGWSIAPFVHYAPLGQNYGGTKAYKELYHVGTPFTLSMMDPFVLRGDLNYGKISSDFDDMGTSGWLFDIALDYTGFDFMSLSLAYAYSTGMDSDLDDGGEVMPVVSDSWALGSFWFGGGLITGDDIGDGQANMGFHALALSATGIQSFAEGLTHDAHIVWAKGTNDKESTADLTYGRSLTEKDQMWELDFNTMYQLYDELTLYNGIGYINLDADSNYWGDGLNGGDAWKFQIGAVYQF